MKISVCKQDFKYMVVTKNGLIEKKSQDGFLYADDVFLISKYGMNVSEKSQRCCV